MPVALRRWLVACLNGGFIALLAVGLYRLLAHDGLIAAEYVILVGFCLATPWTVLGFWNAVIGLVLRHGPAKPEKSIYPFFNAGPMPPRAPSPDTLTALVMTLRNEPPEPSFERLEAMRASLDAAGIGDRFRFHVLSDTTDPAVARAEESAFERFRSAFPESAQPGYRRRTVNTRFKAGNIAEFLEAEGDRYTFFLPLDSDSVMGADIVARMVETMERYPRIGILQSLVVGSPAASGFARMFQFGMRHGMRIFTLGASWWNADCGSYWGHNALIRVEPFRRHCALPDLPGRGTLSGPVLSHDQLEATFMRRAGYDVRVIPVESESFEANPPTLPDFAKRDLRWCMGNMQYWRFLVEPGLKPLSRFQVLQAILMYMAPPAWIAVTIAACSLALTGNSFNGEYLALGIGMFLVIFGLSIAPKVAGVIDVALTPGGIAAYGGAGRFAIAAFIELLASMLLAPIVAVYITVFLAGLPFGRKITWSGQNRDALGVSWRCAAFAMIPQTVLGLALSGVLLTAGPAALAWAVPFLAGLLLAVPFTVITAAPSLGRACSRAGLFALPEETALPPVLQGVVPLSARRWRVHERGRAPRLSGGDGTLRRPTGV